jgi:lysophospholipase L1-like esterase
MSAKHGMADAGRKRGRIVGCCAALALALCALVVGPAVASAESTYVATGDSITFGYSQEKFNVNFPNESPSYFEEGFDHWLTLNLKKATEVGGAVIDVNTACPGETSNGFIGENTAIGGETSTEPNGGEEVFNARAESEGKIQGEKDWHPCAYRSLNGLPLHDSLGNHSQLEEVLSILKEGHPAHPVRAITLNIGSNDELAAVATCKHEVTIEYELTGKSAKYGGSTPEESVTNCIGAGASKTFGHILKNIGDILGVIDSQSAGGGHFTGAIVLMGYYNPDSFVLPGSDALQSGLNEAVEHNILPHFPNVTYANPFPKINVASGHVGHGEEVEQAAICKYTEMCNPNVQVAGGKPAGKDGDIHPSLAGYKLLASLANKAWLANPAK